MTTWTMWLLQVDDARRMPASVGFCSSAYLQAHHNAMLLVTLNATEHEVRIKNVVMVENGNITNDNATGRTIRRDVSFWDVLGLFGVGHVLFLLSTVPGADLKDSLQRLSLSGDSRLKLELP